MAQIKRFRPSWRDAIPALILTLGLTLTVLVYYRAQVADEERVHNALRLRVEWRTLDLQSKILDASVPVEALSMFIASQKELDQSEFHSFALQAEGKDPVSRLTWAPRITSSERSSFEAVVKNPIREVGENGSLVVAGERDTYLPVLFEEQFEKRPTPFGFDIMSEPIRHATAERARDEGEPIATPPVAPVTNLERTPSYTLFWPVYKDGVTPTSINDRRTALVGFVTGSYRLNEVLDFAISGTPDIVAKLSLFIDKQADGPSPVPLVFYNPATQKTEIGQNPLGNPTPDGRRLTRSFEQFGQRWTLVFDFPPDVILGLRSWTRWWDLTIGLLLTFLLTAYVMLELRRRLAIEAKVVERTQDLRQTTDQLTTMIEASPNSIVCLDSNLRVIIWNHTAEQTFGYLANEVIGRPYPLVPADEQTEFERRLARIAKGEILRGIESHRRRKDGTLIDTNSSAAAFYDSTGALQGIILAIEETTERNHIQRQLVHAQKLETVGQLTGGLAHDFNNILGSIVGNLDLASENAVPDSTTAKYCKKALDAALSAAELVQRLLAFSRRQPLQPKPTDVATVITDLTPLLMRTLGEHIRVNTKIPNDLWTVTSDIVQLENAILNLAINARDAMPDGGTLTVEASNTPVDQAFALASDDLRMGDYVVLSVSDTGTGIAPDILSRVLEPFFTTKAPGAGSGLGLSMVFGTMKQLGGTARIYSEVGIGTIVRLYLPRNEEAPENKQGSRVSDSLAPTGHERILMVEDNSQIRAVGVEILRGLGYQVTLSESGDEAIKHIENGDRFDLLFSDVIMPGRLNGIALARKIRACDPSVRILFTSGFTNPITVRDEISELGADLISKPYRKADLAARVRSILDGREAT